MLWKELTKKRVKWEHNSSPPPPLDLATLDDSLFGSTKVKRRLTRNQKRAQARDKGTDAERFSSLSSLQRSLRSPNRMTNNCCPSVRRIGMDFTLGKVFSVITVKTTGGDERDQVVPSKHRREMAEPSYQPILATNVQQERSCGTSTGQESSGMSLPSTRCWALDNIQDTQ